MTLHLISHALCPYVQRAAIALNERDIAFKRTDIDLADKPDWFLAISPLGKTPVLLVGEAPIFESAAILEYLEDSQPGPLHPSDLIKRAQHRGWIEFSSSLLNDIAGLYTAPDEGAFTAKIATIAGKFSRLEASLTTGPFFSGADFSLVDASFAPVFRYFDTLDRYLPAQTFTYGPKMAAWRLALARRPCARDAVSQDYDALLTVFLLKRPSHLAKIITDVQADSDPVALEAEL